jgi:hypothetical protein
MKRGISGFMLSLWQNIKLTFPIYARSLLFELPSAQAALLNVKIWFSPGYILVFGWLAYMTFKVWRYDKRHFALPALAGCLFAMLLLWIVPRKERRYFGFPHESFSFAAYIWILASFVLFRLALFLVSCFLFTTYIGSGVKKHVDTIAFGMMVICYVYIFYLWDELESTPFETALLVIGSQIVYKYKVFDRTIRRAQVVDCNPNFEACILHFFVVFEPLQIVPLVLIFCDLLKMSSVYVDFDLNFTI